MATAEELLATVGNEENIIVIDSDLRTMTFPASVKNIGVENDKDVHKLNFMMPRYFGEYDLSKFNIRINYLNAQGDGDMYVVTELTVEDDAIYFTWLVGRHACLYKGAVTFIVCLKLADGEGDVAQEYNTTLASLQVLPGLETEPTILETDYDIIEQLLLTVQDTNGKIKAVLDSGMTAEELGNIAKEQKTLKSRMDEFASLPDGSTAGDAELTDIRVGSDGATYKSAGEAVRTQVGDLKSAIINEGISYDLFSLYGIKRSGTARGVTFEWNGDGYTVSGTASEFAFHNIIDKDLSAIHETAPFKCRIEMTGNFQNVYIMAFAMQNGNILERKEVPSSGIVTFSNTAATGLIIRLQVNQGATASGSIKVRVLSKDMTPFGSHVFDWLANGAELNSIADGFHMLSDSYTYLHEPPAKPSYLMSFTLYNTELQISYPYFPNSDSPYMRSKRVNGTWTEWTSLNGNNQDIKQFAVDGVINIDDAKIPGFYLIYDSFTYQNLPYTGIGFLFVWKSLTAQLQVAIPWNTNIICMRRNLHNGTWSAWKTVSGGNTYNVTNEYTFHEYSQSVTLNVSPSIAADTNNYLAPTGDTTDRTADILAMLTATGICRLGAGNYYVSNLQMPDGSAIIGSGYATRIRLAGTADGYAIKMGSRCLVQDLQIAGAESDLTFGETIGSRHGILWQGNYTKSQAAPNRSMVSNVWICNFTGGGITCYDTGYGTASALEVVNAYVFSCWAGINISYWSEFHKFTNVRSSHCRIGCVNNGGNNLFINCDFSSSYEIAMLMDNSQGQSPNNTHGSAIGCVFNHTGHAGTSNAGIGIEILNCRSGFTFSGCQIFFSQIHLVDSDGIVISDTIFGNRNCDVNISGGGAVLFSGCMVEGAIPITIDDNQNVHFVNCYNKATGAVWSD